MYEGFVPYENIDQAKANLSLSGKSNVFMKVTTKTATKVIVPIFMPRRVAILYTVLMHLCLNIKVHLNFDIDWAYDFGPLLGYPQGDLFRHLLCVKRCLHLIYAPGFFHKPKDMLLWEPI